MSTSGHIGISVELPEIKAGFPSPAQDYVENGIDLKLKPPTQMKETNQ